MEMMIATMKCRIVNNEANSLRRQIHSSAAAPTRERNIVSSLCILLETKRATIRFMKKALHAFQIHTRIVHNES